MSNREIRVFISSTFLDMQQERDHLVKFVFPQLRRLCEARGVTWGEVDLRWGISDEQKAEGKVLALCLEEIQRCRPYFIGLLGERYGWIPPAVSAELIERQGWLRQHAGRSVTELEIVHGVLGDQSMHGHAYFYFRDPMWIDRLPSGCDRKAFVEGSPQGSALLAKLKQRIRAAYDEEVCQLRENYGDPQELGRWILDDFTHLIDRLWPESETLDPLERERMAHQAYAASRTQVYIGRKDEYERLDGFVGGPPRGLCLTGESGSGKSSLLANWWERRRETHTDEFIIAHFVGASVDSADWAALVRRILAELKQRFGFDLDIPDDPAALRQALPRCLRMAGTRSRVILILDGLDKLEARDGARDLVWLPSVPAPNVYVLVSSLPGPTLEALGRMQWEMWPVRLLEPEERGELVKAYLATYSKALESARVAKLSAARPCANPVYLRAILNELRQLGERRRLDETIDRYLTAQTPAALFQLVLARWEEDFDGVPHLVRDAFTALWAARKGLSEAELLEHLGSSGAGPLPRAFWSPLLLAAESSLINRSGLLGFSHDFLREAVRERYLNDAADQRNAHGALAKYFARAEGSGPRKLEELPWQLAEAEEWPALQRLVSDEPFFRALWLADAYSARTYWARLSEHGGKVTETYRDLIAHPAANPLGSFLIAELLIHAGEYEDAGKLLAAISDHFRSTGERRLLALCLANQAAVLKTEGDLDGAARLYREQEALCQEAQDGSGLIISRAGLAGVLAERGETDAALTLYAQVEGLCRQRGDFDRLQKGIGSRAQILRRHGRLDEAMALLKEQERMCRELDASVSLLGCLGDQALVQQDRGRWDEALATYRSIELGLRKVGDKAWLVRNWVNQSSVLIRRRRFDEAMSVLTRALSSAEEMRDEDGRQACLGGQAQVLAARGEWDGAVRLSRAAEAICRRTGNAVGLQTILMELATSLKHQGDAETGLNLLHEAERLARKRSDQAGLAAILDGEGLILRGRGELEGALRQYQEAEAVCRAGGFGPKLAQVLVNQSVVFQIRGDLDQAMSLLLEAERIARALEDQSMLAGCLGNLGIVRLDRGDIADATATFGEAEKLCREIGDERSLAICLGYQASLRRAKGDVAGAVSLYSQEGELCRKVGDPAALEQALGNQVLALRELKRWPEALARSREHEQICIQLNDAHALCRCLDIQASVLCGGGNFASAVSKFKQVIGLCRQLGEWRRLVIAGNNCALVLAHQLHQPSEALSVVEEAYRVAVDHDLKDDAEKIQPFRDQLRNWLKKYGGG